MRWRVIFFISLAVNVALAAAWLFSTRTQENDASPPASSSVTPGSPSSSNIVVRRQFFSWQEIESPDYRQYIANLREIGCPEKTIRDIVIADVNDLYDQRKATEVVTPQQQWWRTDVDTNVLMAARAKLRTLEQERRALLSSLLGPDWDAQPQAVAQITNRISLDGALLGALPDEIKDAVQTLSARSAEQTQAYINAQRAAGKEPDPAELARLRQQTRDELARLLTPQQLEEFLLRYSQNAINLRASLSQLPGFQATPEEFRKMFRAMDSIELQLQALAGKTDYASQQQRAALEQQRETALRNTLGVDRYAQYHLVQDPVYQAAMTLAQQNNSPSSVPLIYDILQTGRDEQQRIQNMTNLTAEQKQIELRRIELEQLRAQTAALGHELPPEPPMPPAPTPRNVHVIAEGESVGTLSLRYQVPVHTFYDANPSLDLRTLRPGDSIVIPPTARIRQ